MPPTEIYHNTTRIVDTGSEKRDDFSGILERFEIGNRLNESLRIRRPNPFLRDLQLAAPVRPFVT